VNPLSSICRAINRDDEAPIRVISFSCHEAFQTALSSCNCEFAHIPSPEGKKWESEYREMPANIIELDSAERLEFADCILSHTQPQRELSYTIAGKYNLPHIGLCHIYPDPNLPPRIIEGIKASNRCDKLVFITEDLANKWGYEVDGCRVHAINTGIDTDKFRPSEEDARKGAKLIREGGKILTVCNYYKERGAELGYDLYQQVKAIVKSDLFLNVGKSNDGSSSPLGLDEIVKCYQDSAVFLNTATRSTFPTALIEAMSVGIPVITTPNPTLEKLIKHGENGMIAKDAMEFAQCLNAIFQDTALAIKCGLNARETIQEGYSLSIFRDSWMKVFESILKR